MVMWRVGEGGIDSSPEFIELWKPKQLLSGNDEK